MVKIEISQVSDSGERCWGVSVITEDGTVLESHTPMAKGVARATAKVLKHWGGNAPFVSEPPRRGPAWVPKRDGDRWLLRFTEVTATLFVLRIGDLLRDATIAWNPPEADPAHDHKEDTTPATHDGS